ncbi:MAG: extracellular solute-binding protein [Spirochaetaceae bacterium]|nr:extracellular solute-binding protein [Spirochaetaceae bacterium]MDT8296697.1 extracellular solute-binding protein [Spirochaetaceae bacterium]
MKTTLRVITVFILLSFGFSTIAANGGKDESSLPPVPSVPLDPDTPGWTLDTSPVQFDWYLNFAWFRGIWGEDPVSRYVTEKTGVDIEFIIPAGNEADKLNTMIASGSLPDFVTLGWWEPQVKEIIAGEMAYPLDVLAKNYDPYFFKVAVPERVGWYTQDDGHIYCYPNASYSPSDYDKYELTSYQTFLVRKDMYEALGSPSMRTPQEFLRTLERAKAMFPEVNGQPLIPLGFKEFSDTGNDALENYLMNFLAIPMEKNGRYYDRYADPEYKRWLNTFREAQQRGLIANDVYLDRRAQMEEKIAQGRYFAMFYQHTDMIDAQALRFSEDPDSIYIAVDGPANSNMDDPRLAGQGLSGWTVTFISKSVDDPDRAIRFMSYMMSEEGQRDLYLGIEGVTWEAKDGREGFLPEVAELLNTDRAAFDKQYGASVKYWMLMDNPMFAQWETDPVTPYKELSEWTKSYTESYAIYDNIDPLPFEPEGIVAAKLSSLFGKYLPKLLKAESESEFNALWNELQEERQKIGLEKLMAFKQERINANKAKLGL